jgi:hypothetical protein
MYFDGLTLDGIESRSAHVTLNGEILFSGCAGVVARPIGANSTYPPTQSSGNPGGFHVEFDLGAEGILAVDITPNFILVQALGSSLAGSVAWPVVLWGRRLMRELHCLKNLGC